MKGFVEDPSRASRALLAAKKRGCKLVVLDPVFTETAQKADEWIPLKPGSDAALALAMCRIHSSAIPTVTTRKA